MRDNRMIISSVIIVTAHLKVLKAKSKVLSLTRNRIKSTQIPILKSYISLISLVSSSKLLHGSGYELVRCFSLSQSNTLFLLTNLFRGSYSFKALIVCFGEGVVVIVVVCS